MAEIFKDGVYAPFFSGRSNLTVLDVGANIGIFSLYASQFAKTVYAIEPSFEHFSTLSHMLAHNQITNVKPFNNALYIEEKKYHLYRNPNKTMFSLHQAIADPSLGSEPVQAIVLDKFLEEQGIEQVDFMKLDVEGSEIEIVSSESFRNAAPKIDTIVVESHAWSGRHPNQLKDALKLNGYQVEQIPNDASLFVATRR